MSLLSWLEDRSDILSPIVVKEVRQIVRGREFNYAFGGSLIVGLAVAFFGAADALTGAGTAGRWTFMALMMGLAVLGVGIVPLGAFSALRNERLEQTLDLITLTALSPWRVIVGKLLAQGVKLLTLFAGIAPFIAMSFLLGGIDFITIVVWLLMMFMWSVWAIALCLFLSTVFKSRALTGIVFGGFALAMLVLVSAGRAMLLAVSRGGVGLSFSIGPDTWWLLAMITSFCAVSLINLVLLGENRLTLPTENRVSKLRIGFLAQALLLAGWTLSYVHDIPTVKSNAVEGLMVLGSLHLAMVALFAVSEDLAVPRRVARQLDRLRGWRSAAIVFMPGGGRGAAYVMMQMGILLLTAWALDADGMAVRFFLAACGFICFFSGVAALGWRIVEPEGHAALKVRVSVLVLVFASTVLPDLVHYVFGRPDLLDLSFAWRHLVNPFRTLANWRVVETNAWFFIPFAMGAMGLFAYVLLIRFGMRVTGQPAPERRVAAPPAAEEPGSADIIY